MIEDALRGLTALEDGGDHQIRSAHHVAAGEDLGVAGLAGVGVALRADAAVAFEGNTEFAHPGSRTGPETEGHDHLIGGDHFLGPRDDFRLATATRVRRAELGGDELDAFDVAVADDLDRLAIEQSAHPLRRRCGIRAASRACWTRRAGTRR